MKCQLAPSPLYRLACTECGVPRDAPGDYDCEAEATVAELVGMALGRLPPRAVVVLPSQVRQVAAALGNSVLSPEELAELFPASDPTLLGNRLEVLFARLGLPPCPGCLGRRDWLNSAHLMAREIWGLA